MQRSVVVFLSHSLLPVMCLQSTAVRTGRRVLKYHFSTLGSRSEHGTGATIALANLCLKTRTSPQSNNYS